MINPAESDAFQKNRRTETGSTLQKCGRDPAEEQREIQVREELIYERFARQRK